MLLLLLTMDLEFAKLDSPERTLPELSSLPTSVDPDIRAS